MQKYFEYQFEWDPNKAIQNAKKHRLTFERAASVFRDPLSLSRFDSDHGGDEDRWITLGVDQTGIPIVVCHTFLSQGISQARVRIISARKATKKESMQYGRQKQ
ncbi:MAG: BrnT family toxin [Elusimicrobia bacterium]|nr:BrnT family toxin [Elusimicrobiota bacterium]